MFCSSMYGTNTGVFGFTFNIYVSDLQFFYRVTD